jgi:hypothetical protein
VRRIGVLMVGDENDLETQDAALVARIEVAADTVADLDRRLGQIDVAIETAAKRGKTGTAMAAIESQRKIARRVPWPSSRPSAPPWSPKAARPKSRPRPSSTSLSSSAPTRTASGQSGGS